MLSHKSDLIYTNNVREMCVSVIKKKLETNCVYFNFFLPFECYVYLKIINNNIYPLKTGTDR